MVSYNNVKNVIEWFFYDIMVSLMTIILLPIISYRIDTVLETR